MAGESKLQKKIRIDLEKNGWLVVKIKLCSLNGWPDQQAHKNGRTVFLEIKDKGKKAKPLQEYRHEQIRTQGFNVFTIDTWELYLEIKDAYHL